MVENRTRKLLVIFAVLYFVQGTGELSAGLLAQPLRSLLRGWGRDAAEIATFMFLLGIPWYIKPVFGLISDFMPLRGLRRKSYLILSSAMMIGGFLAAALLPLEPSMSGLLLVMLLIPSFGIAFKDVATDATMIESGQPLGITGRLQSAQWGAMYAAGLLCGVGGGWLSQHGQQRLGFLVCALLGAVALYIAVFHIEERPRPELQRGQLRRAIKVLGVAMRTRIIVLIAIFYFLLSFNPFSADVLYVHMTAELGFSEQFVGLTYTISSLASILACVLYGLYSKRISLRFLLHGSVAFIVLASLVYIGLGGRTSAIVISFAYGFIYMVTNLTQLELAGRYCPTAAAGTVFALLMSLANLSVSLSSIVGGRLYGAWTLSMGSGRAFTMLVIVGAGFSALGWLLIPLFPKSR